MTIAISAFTAPKPDAELSGLVKGLTPRADDSSVGLLGRPVFWAAISLGVLIVLNAVFW